LIQAIFFPYFLQVNATSIPASFIQYAFAERIGGHTFGIKKNIYKFEQIKLAKAQAIQKRPEQPILDMGVGQPQDMVHPAIVQSLQHAAEKEEYQGYADNGGYRFKAAVQAYMKGCYGVDLDAQTQIIHCIGAKSALSLLPAAFINPGDIVLTTTPGYMFSARMLNTTEARSSNYHCLHLINFYLN